MAAMYQLDVVNERTDKTTKNSHPAAVPLSSAGVLKCVFRVIVLVLRSHKCTVRVFTISAVLCFVRQGYRNSPTTTSSSPNNKHRLAGHNSRAFTRSKLNNLPQSQVCMSLKQV